jgi:uncharacterized repeat protein (TIGR03943 family)
LFLYAAAMGILHLFRTGRLSTFIHPRMFPLLLGSAAILAVLAFLEYLVWRPIRSTERLGWRHLAWLLPFLAAGIADPTGLSLRMAQRKGTANVAATLGVGAGESTADTLLSSLFPDTATPPPDTNSFRMDVGRRNNQAAETTTVQVQSHPQRDSGWCPSSARASGCVDSLLDGNWYQRSISLYSSPARHCGSRVHLVGFISGDDRFGGRSFYLARMLIWCCAADAMPIGFYCDPGSENFGFRPGQWISLTGTVTTRINKLPGWKKPGPVPVLVDLQVVPTFPPPEPYVYTLSW